MKTALAIVGALMNNVITLVGAIYCAAWVLAAFGYADMQVCFAWKGSCSTAATPSTPAIAHPRRAV